MSEENKLAYGLIDNQKGDSINFSRTDHTSTSARNSEECL